MDRLSSGYNPTCQIDHRWCVFVRLLPRQFTWTYLFLRDPFLAHNFSILTLFHCTALPGGTILISRCMQMTHYCTFPARRYKQEVDAWIARVEACISDIRQWMKESYLKLNDGKPAFVIVGSKQQLAKFHTPSLRIGTMSILPVSKVRDL